MSFMIVAKSLRKASFHTDFIILPLFSYDIHRGSGSRSISGIARLDGMCDPWNTCTLAEGLDFTSAFIGTHELGHRYDKRIYENNASVRINQ